MSDDKLKSASNRISIKRKDGNNSSIVKVESGTKAKFYLEVINVPQNTIGYRWIIGNGDPHSTLQKITKSNSVVVELSNSLCGRIAVQIICITDPAKMPPPEFVFTDKNYALEEKTDAERIFVLECPRKIKNVNFCFNHNEIPRIPKDNVYEIAPRAMTAFSIQLEGYNGEEFSATVISKKGIHNFGTAQVKKNYVVFKDYFINYDEKDEDDLLIFSFMHNKRLIGRFFFNLKIFQHKLRAEEIEANKQVVVVGQSMQMAENNYHPCKFLDVEIREIEPNKNIIAESPDEFKRIMDNVFGTSWRILKDRPFTNSLTFTEAGKDEVKFVQRGVNEIISEEKKIVMTGNSHEKDLLVLVKEFTTSENDCDNVPAHKKVVYLKKSSTEKKEYPIKNNEAHIEITYPYETNCIDFPWKYLFPIINDISHEIVIESCRRTLTIPVIVYPDIQWFLGVKIKISKGIETKVEGFKKLFSKEVFNAAKKKNEENNFSIGITVNWDENNKSSLLWVIYPKESKSSKGNINIVDKILELIEKRFKQKMLEVLRMLQDIVSLIELFKLANSLAENLPDFSFAKERKSICSIEINALPDTTLGLSWRAGTYNGEGGLVIEGAGQGDIISVKGTIDLFCLASKLSPAVREAIRALELLEWAADLSFKFELIIEGSLKWHGKIGYDLSQKKDEGELAIGGLLEITLKACMETNPSQSFMIGTEVKKEYGLRGVCGISGDFIIEYLKNDIIKEKDKDGKEIEKFYEPGIYTHQKSKFNSIVIQVYVKTTIRRYGDGKKCKTDESNERTINNKILIKEFNINTNQRERII